MTETMTLWRPTGTAELDLVRAWLRSRSVSRVRTRFTSKAEYLASPATSAFKPSG